MFVGLKDFEERTTPELSGQMIANQLNGQFSSIQDAMVLVLQPPPVNGIGTTGGFKLMVEDRSDRATKPSTAPPRASSARPTAAASSPRFTPATP